MTQNTLPLTKPMLETLLVYLSNILSISLRIVVHGGACMLLHPGLERIPTQRVSTMDIDYLHRGVVAEYGPEAATDLLQCIYKTALKFPGLGIDWMNAEADISLPVSQTPPHDPVHHASIQPNNLALHTIFTSPNRRLVLVSVTPFWGVALKLIRYGKYDMVDICALLRNGTRMRGVKWTADVVERWLRTECPSMRYDLYDPRKLEELRQRIRQVVYFVQDAPWLQPQGTAGMDLSASEQQAIQKWEDKLRSEAFGHNVSSIAPPSHSNTDTFSHPMFDSSPAPDPYLGSSVNKATDVSPIPFIPPALRDSSIHPTLYDGRGLSGNAVIPDLPFDHHIPSGFYPTHFAPNPSSLSNLQSTPSIPLFPTQNEFSLHPGQIDRRPTTPFIPPPFVESLR